MKWFKHETDAYTNLKLQIIRNEFGFEGYGFFWLVLELVAQQGKNFVLSTEKQWFEALMGITGFKKDKLDKFLSRLADLNLIDKKSLTKGILFIPKMSERADEYTAKLLTKSKRVPTTPDYVGLEKKRIEENRREYITSRPEIFKKLKPEESIKNV